MLLEKAKRAYRFYFKNPPKAKIAFKTKIERHGSSYGGWNIIPDSLDKNSVVYSFGIGQDVSFDQSIIRKYGCKVHGFDPTPRVIDWLKTQNIAQEFVFHPIGLSHEDGTLTFYTPKNEQNISHTAHKSENSVAMEVSCKKLATILKELKHEKIDVLKMDIEGFEYAVLENMIKERIFPTQLLVEFHHFFPEKENSDTENMISFLATNGYQLFNVSDSFCEYSFIKQS